MSDIIYIVAGSHRTGTSMMMACLAAGGLSAARCLERDQACEAAPDGYSLNSGGLWELSPAEYKAADFPLAHLGSLIKVLNHQVLSIAARDNLRYKIVFMLRDPEEMRQSWQAAFGPFAIHPLWGKYKKFKIVADEMFRILDSLRARADTEVHHLWYRDVVALPLLAFQALAARGWPIDAVKAARVVDPEQCRYRHEELSVGA